MRHSSFGAFGHRHGGPAREEFGPRDFPLWPWVGGDGGRDEKEVDFFGITFFGTCVELFFSFFFVLLLLFEAGFLWPLERCTKLRVQLHFQVVGLISITWVCQAKVSSW